jgi:general secretion pathway protein G
VRPSVTFWILFFGILAVGYYLIVPRIGEPSERARPTAAWEDIHGGIKSALDQYKVDNGDYPKSIQDLVKKSDDAKNWRGPYFDPPRIPIDPWGNNYIYEFPGKHNPTGYDLYSAGPDGKPGDNDDIANWQ